MLRAVLGLGSMFVTINKATLEIAKRRQVYLQASVAHDRSDLNRQRISNGNSASEFVSTNRSERGRSRLGLDDRAEAQSVLHAGKYNTVYAGKPNRSIGDRAPD
jgi:hypothetical protein